MADEMNAVGIDESVLDSAWEDDDAGMADGAQTSLENQQAGEQKPENPPAATETNTDPKGQEAKGQENPPELFAIQFHGKTEQVTREELLALAQKGRNYDHVHGELEELRQYRQEADPALELVKGYAQRNGMTVGDYLDFCRKQELMRGGLTEEAAGQKLVMEKERAELDRRQAEIAAQEQARTSAAQQEREREQARKRDIEAFFRAYPDVDPKTIPQEVFAAVRKGDSLVNAYTMHENRRLTAELAAERQNKANQAKAPGSLGGNSVTEADEIDRLWAEDD